MKTRTNRGMLDVYPTGLGIIGVHIAEEAPSGTYQAFQYLTPAKAKRVAAALLKYADKEAK